MAAKRQQGGADSAIAADLPKNLPPHPVLCGKKATGGLPQRGTAI
jgi:hypothetical protein